MATTTQDRFEVPYGLVKAINDGTCVAFLGSGFTAPAGLPSWGQLLNKIAGRTRSELIEHVRNRVAEGTAHAYDEAAQILQDELGGEFARSLREVLGTPQENQVMSRRLQLLRGIPFRGILTLNYDAVLDGDVTSPEAYRSFLRPRKHRWWADRFLTYQKGAPVLKLHGDLTRPETVVLTRRDYRRRLYADPAYMTFLRSVLSQQTVLYLGFSFADAYLNELRSEILSLFGQGGYDAPLAYAVISDVPEPTRDHFQRHEGVRVMTYDTSGDPTHGGFDRILSAIHERTDAVFRFGRMMQDKRLLWVDARPANNAPAYAFLARAVKSTGATGHTIEEARDAAEAVAKLASARAAATPYDLLITHWGTRRARDADGNSISTAERLMYEMRAQDFRCPVLVFSIAEPANVRKPIALGLGAQGYYFTFGGLLRGIERVLADGSEEFV